MTKLTKTLAILFLSAGLALAEMGVTNYTATTGTNKRVSSGCKYVMFDLVGYSGQIGNVTYSNITKQIQVFTGQDGDRLSDIPYTVTSGTLNILEVR